MIGYGENKGVVPLATQEIFDRIKANTDPEKSYEVTAMMCEIYNEKVQDLMV
jgi:kinesin family member 1